MSIQIKLIKLTNNELIIEPVRNESVHSFSYAPTSDLSIELSELKKELKNLELIEGRDFVTISEPYPGTAPKYRLQFSSTSLVIRALYTIPTECI